MLYLVHVDPEDGPFGYVRGSHTWHRSPFISALQNGFDATSTDIFEIERDQLDYKLGYYRPRFKLAEQRQNMLLLPPMLRGSTHFGDDILDGTDVSNELLSREVVFKGEAGMCVLFDGSRGVHRGSLARTGRRWAVQIGLRVWRENPSPSGRKLGVLRGQLRKLRPLRDRVQHAKYISRELYYLVTD
jgi:hypothetical protein